MIFYSLILLSSIDKSVRSVSSQSMETAIFLISEYDVVKLGFPLVISGDGIVLLTQEELSEYLMNLLNQSLSDHLMLFLLVEKFWSHRLGRPDIRLCYNCLCVYFIVLNVIVLLCWDSAATEWYPEVWFYCWVIVQLWEASQFSCLDNCVSALVISLQLYWTVEEMFSRRVPPRWSICTVTYLVTFS